MASPRALALLAFGALGGCRSCAGAGSVPTARDSAADVPVTAAPLEGEDALLCEREVAHASVGAVPGAGPLDALVPSCGEDGTLLVWALRGHTLSRLSRGRLPGSTFSVPEVIATGVDSLGATDAQSAVGPLAWRSPTAGLEGESDVWWAARLEPGDGGMRSVFASVTMPAGTQARGILAPMERTPEGVMVLGSVAGGEDNPRLVRQLVRLPGGEPQTLAREPARLETGILEAWEPSQRVALVTVVEEGHTLLRAMQFVGERLVARGDVRVEQEHVLVQPRGVGRGGESLFAFSGFTLSTGRERCIEVDPSRCAAPGEVTVVRVSAAGVRAMPVAPFGLVDTMALDERERLLVLYVGEGGSSRAARLEPDRELSSPAQFAPAADLPPLDRPSLVRCGRRPWLVAEVRVPGENPGDTGEVAVLAVPAQCVVR